MTTKSPRLAQTGTVLLVLLLVLVGCGSTDEPDSDDTTAAPTTGDAANGTGASGAGNDAAGGEERVLRVASVESIDNWDPLAQANPSYMNLVYDNLLSVSPDGLELEPELATEWEQTAEYIEFTLRDDATFHDGTPVNAEAIAMNIERMQTTPFSAQATFANISGIETPDEYTVRINLSKPTGGILEELAGFVGSIVAPAAIEEGSFEEPIGAGPWQYNAEESVPGSEVVVDAFADYYDAENVGPTRIVYLEVFDAEQRYNALQTGDADVIYGTGSLANRAEADGFEVAVYPKVSWAVMLTDIEGVFSDVHLRQAVCHAIDTQPYLDAQFDGFGENYTQPFPEGAPGHNPDVEGYPYDVEAAQALMAEAGNPEVSFTLPTSDEYQPIAQVFASQMAEIGITVDLNVMPFGEYFGEYNSGDSPMILFSTAADTGPYSYYTRRFDPGGALNPPGLEYPDLQAIVQEGASADDPEAADESWMAFTVDVVENAYDCGTFGLPGIWISNPESVTNIVPTNYQIDAFRYAEAEVIGD